MTNNDEINENEIQLDPVEDLDEQDDKKFKEALKLVKKRANEELQLKAMRLRRLALTAITLSVGTLLIAIFSGIGLFYWYNTKVILITSMYIVRFTAENLGTVQTVHAVSASLTFVFYFIFIVLFLNFQKLYSEVVHQGKTRKVTGFITSTVGLVAIVMIVLSMLTGFAIPDKKDQMTETQKKLADVNLTDESNPKTLAEMQKQSMDLSKIGAQEIKKQKFDLNFLLHTSLLPIIFGILMLILLFDVYTLQKAKFREITPKIKPH